MHRDNLGLRDLQLPEIAIAEYKAGPNAHQVITETGLLTMIQERDTFEREEKVIQLE